MYTGTQSHTPYSKLPPDYQNNRYCISISDLAQVLNVTSSQLFLASSSLDVSMESTNFAERLDNSFTSLIQPYRYTSFENSSSLQPTTMLFGCSLPDDLNGAGIGRNAVVIAFESILSSAAKKHRRNLYEAVFNAHKRQGDEIKLVSTSL